MKAGRLESGFSAILDITPGAAAPSQRGVTVAEAYAAIAGRAAIAEIPATEETTVAQAVVRQPSGVASGTPSAATATMGQLSTTPVPAKATTPPKKTGGLFAPKVVEPVAEAEPDVVELDDRALDQLEEQTDVADASDGDDGLPAPRDEEEPMAPSTTKPKSIFSKAS